MTHLGPHALPLIGRADWNDCLNLNCFSNDPNESYQTTENKKGDSKAESLMIAGQFVMCGEQYAELCKAIGNTREYDRAMQHVEAMAEAVKKHGWDGEWFLRAYDYFGRPVGSKENKESKIFIESQGWCSMAKIGLEEGLVNRALESVRTHLDSPHGIVLNNPAFTEYVPEYGEISSYPPGYKENAGIFAHNNPWIIVAETIVGNGDRAWEYYTKIAPAWVEEHSDLHKVEPYVYSQMTAGKDAPNPGQAKNSWLTGTAAWNWLTVSQYILGIQPEFNGLRIDPCIPSDMKGYELDRTFRGAHYHIRVMNPDGVCKGVKSITVNGLPVTGNIINVFPEGSNNTVDVVMG